MLAQCSGKEQPYEAKPQNQIPAKTSYPDAKSNRLGGAFSLACGPIVGWYIKTTGAVWRSSCGPISKRVSKRASKHEFANHI